MGLGETGSIVFDAYGTLFQTEPLEQVAEAIWPGQGADLARLWHRLQRRYAMVYGLLERFADFWQITEEALVDSARRLALPLSATVRFRLLRAHLALPPYPDVPRTLSRLAGRNRRLAILSEGTPAMLRTVVRRADLVRHLTAIISTEEARTYRPVRQAYALVTDALGVAPGEVWFVTAHDDWDLPGAANAGFRTVWVNRRGLPRAAIAPVPDLEVRSLTELVRP